MSSTRYYVLSQIHGNLSHLVHHLEKIDQDHEQNPTDHYQLVMLGDFIDYGNSSKAIVDYLLAPHAHTEQFTVLLGNHEHMLLSFLDSIENGPLWLTHGGLNTLSSYGIECDDYAEAIEELHILQTSLQEMLPQDHLNYLKSLKPYFETEEFIFTHAGFDHSRNASENDLEALLWGEVIQPLKDSNKCLVHTDHGSLEIQVEKNWVRLPGKHSRKHASCCTVLQTGAEPRQL
jgi:serine/threonine protein phosphatase 1